MNLMADEWIQVTKGPQLAESKPSSDGGEKQDKSQTNSRRTRLAFDCNCDFNKVTKTQALVESCSKRRIQGARGCAYQNTQHDFDPPDGRCFNLRTQHAERASSPPLTRLMASTTSEYVKTTNFSFARRGFLLSALERVLNTTQDAVANWSSVQSIGGSSSRTLGAVGC